MNINSEGDFWNNMRYYKFLCFYNDVHSNASLSKNKIKTKSFISVCSNIARYFWNEFLTDVQSLRVNKSKYFKSTFFWDFHPVLKICQLSARLISSSALTHHYWTSTLSRTLSFHRFNFVLIQWSGLWFRSWDTARLSGVVWYWATSCWLRKKKKNFKKPLKMQW